MLSREHHHTYAFFRSILVIYVDLLVDETEEKKQTKEHTILSFTLALICK